MVDKFSRILLNFYQLIRQLDVRGNNVKVCSRSPEERSCGQKIIRLSCGCEQREVFA